MTDLLDSTLDHNHQPPMKYREYSIFWKIEIIFL